DGVSDHTGGRRPPVAAPVGRAEGVEHVLSPRAVCSGHKLEDSARATINTAVQGRAVQIASRIENQAARRFLAVRAAVGCAKKAVQHLILVGSRQGGCGRKTK